MENARCKYLNVLFLVYIVILFRITVFRSGFSLTHLMQRGTVNLTLFEEYMPLIRQGRCFRFLYLFVGNIVWFVPLGSWLLASKKETGIWMAVLCGFGLSFAIESMQYIFGTGVSELDDLILNTLGAWIGAAAVRGYRWHRCRLASR